jgi:hypothetical protein
MVHALEPNVWPRSMSIRKRRAIVEGCRPVKLIHYQDQGRLDDAANSERAQNQWKVDIVRGSGFRRGPGQSDPPPTCRFLKSAARTS